MALARPTEWKLPSLLQYRTVSLWDAIALGVTVGGLVLIFTVFRQVEQPIMPVAHTAQSLDPWTLPFCALRTTLRMLAALVASFLFSVIYALTAAKSRRAEAILIPILDILQSIPILGYISFTVTFFLALFPGRMLGPELACVFAIFTGQAWNMTFSLYQSLKTMPADLIEASRSFQFGAMQRFLTLELPFAMPGLIWNMMMSMSGGWFFIVAAESVKVGDLQFNLPGIGSYLSAAIEARDVGAVGWTILTMVIVILAYDQLLFRPLVAWADKFRFDTSAGNTAPNHSWVLSYLKRAKVLTELRVATTTKVRTILFRRLPPLPQNALALPGWLVDIVWYPVVCLFALAGLYIGYQHLHSAVNWTDAEHVFFIGACTLLRVTILIAIATVVWVPIGVYIGLRPALAGPAQPIAQFLAAFPANLTFPIAVIGILHFHLDPDLWLSPLIIFGTQWYILFNVIAGTAAFPADLREAARGFHIKGRQWWLHVILPGIMPYYITGAVTATGGAWNASIVSEAVDWGDTHIETQHGLGAYIADMTSRADYPHIVLGIAAMATYVTLTNRMLWRPLYRWSERRFKLG